MVTPHPHLCRRHPRHAAGQDQSAAASRCCRLRQRKPETGGGARRQGTDPRACDDPAASTPCTLPATHTEERTAQRLLCLRPAPRRLCTARNPICVAQPSCCKPHGEAPHAKLPPFLPPCLPRSSNRLCFLQELDLQPWSHWPLPRPHVHRQSGTETHASAGIKLRICTLGHWPRPRAHRVYAADSPWRTRTRKHEHVRRQGRRDPAQSCRHTA